MEINIGDNNYEHVPPNLSVQHNGHVCALCNVGMFRTHIFCTTHMWVWGGGRTIVRTVGEGREGIGYRKDKKDKGLWYRRDTKDKTRVQER